MVKKLGLSRGSLSSTRTLLMLLCVISLSLGKNSVVTKSKAELYEAEYRDLHALTEDKAGLESIKALHQQLDDDNDGTIEPSETGEFIREDLQYRGSHDKHQQQMKQKRFHGQDSEITVKDLWDNWFKSEVHNWTVDQTVEWLIKNVGLPQYEESFRREMVTGTKLPQVAVGNSYLTKVLGVTNPIHRSKITLKAMDVVLFGPPRDSSSTTKDIILTSLLVAAITGLAYAYRQNKKSQEHLKRMMHDMEGLSKAEETLKDLQEKLVQKDEKLESLEMSQNQGDLSDPTSTLEVSRLREEVEVLRNELQKAEIELEDRCWSAPTVLQHWLQLTYELESQTYNAKKKSAEQQLEVAKEMCEKLKRKRMSLVGAFVSTHGGSIDDVDRSILEAKTALLEVTQDLTERTQRWKQIEALCGCSIMTNAGLVHLQKMVRHVTAGKSFTGQRPLSSRLSASLSQEDLLGIDDDVISIAASSTHMTSTSSQLSRALASTPSKIRRQVLSTKPGSSKESTSSDDTHDFRMSSIELNTPGSAESATSTKNVTNIDSELQDQSVSDVIKSNPDLIIANSEPLLPVTIVTEADPINIEPQILSSTNTSSLSSLIPPQPGLSSSQILRNESWAGGLSEDAVSVGSDTSTASKKKKKRTFFSFGKKKEKQKDIL